MMKVTRSTRKWAAECTQTCPLTNEPLHAETIRLVRVELFDTGRAFGFRDYWVSPNGARKLLNEREPGIRALDLTEACNANN